MTLIAVFDSGECAHRNRYGLDNSSLSMEEATKRKKQHAKETNEPATLVSALADRNKVHAKSLPMSTFTRTRSVEDDVNPSSVNIADDDLAELDGEIAAMLAKIKKQEELKLLRERLNKLVNEAADFSTCKSPPLLKRQLEPPNDPSTPRKAGKTSHNSSPYSSGAVAETKIVSSTKKEGYGTSVLAAAKKKVISSSTTKKSVRGESPATPKERRSTMQIRCIEMATLSLDDEGNVIPHGETGMFTTLLQNILESTDIIHMTVVEFQFGSEFKEPELFVGLITDLGKRFVYEAFHAQLKQVQLTTVNYFESNIDEDSFEEQFETFIETKVMLLNRDDSNFDSLYKAACVQLHQCITGYTQNKLGMSKLITDFREGCKTNGKKLLKNMRESGFCLLVIQISS